jgi:hypothetical protein
MRRHLDFLDSGECARRIEWRKCSIPESRTHCVPKFARKFFEKNRVVRSRKSFCEKNSDANGTRFGRKVCMLICIVRDVQMA